LSIASPGAFRTPTAQAGATTPFTVEVDCDTGTAGIQSSCTYPSGTGAITAAVVLHNNSGTNPTVINSFDFKINNSSTAVLTASAAPSAAQAGYTCTPPPAQADTGANPGGTQGFLSCFGGTSSVATGADLVLANVPYNGAGDGTVTLSLVEVHISDDQFSEIASCNPDNVTPATCIGATVTIGSGPVQTFTPVNTATATSTTIPAVTPTPCVGASCPTPTSLAFKTVTPTAGPSTPTAPAGATQPAGTTPPPGGGQPGGQPGGGAGAGQTGTIRLPDTGSGSSSRDWTSMALIIAGVIAAGATAGGAWLGATSYAGRRRKDGE
jgi:hypothetical protein